MKELGLGLWLTAFIFTMSPHGWTRSKNYYPHCSPIAHEIQQAWQRGEIKTEEAGRLIQRCLTAEERGIFIK
ncbi:hypothetical protein STIP28_5 [Synechococcus T7-like virus S-TIP28]|uniref:Uncharacterized protein n=1 Tax=Synechococcus T7-like virus S-TIP28 TaxID=1332140 RepID=A0AAE9BP05_9CAUD|nr:hypothetical protein STIP28_5 [Synechococcus T7-like virus S-TIP28]